MNRNTKRMMYITMLIAMSVLLHFVESLIPIPVPILGVKLGFANIISLITFYMFGFPVMVGVNVARVIMASLLRGVLFGTPFWMSVAGVTLSTIAIGIAGHFFKEGNEVIVSVCSSIAHIVGQIIMAYFIMGTTLIFYYFPIMFLLSIPTGVFTGVIARQVLKELVKALERNYSMEKFTYTPKGVCSRLMTFEVEGTTIKSLNVEGGCNGNLQGISRLLVGMDVHDVIARLEGTHCGMKPTSCPDQMARALKEKFGN